MRRKFGAGVAGLAFCSCGSGLGEVTVQDVSSADPSLPHITVSRLQNCFSIYGGQLQPGRHHFNPVVEVDRDGMRRSVKTPDMPDTAPDLAACTRVALGDMTIPSSMLNMRSTQSVASTSAPTSAQRLYLGNPAVAAVVVVGLSEIVLEAGAYTILFGVTVKVLEKAVEDGWKAVCIAKYAACIAAVGTWKRGNHLGASRCNTCMEACLDVHEWPSSIGNGSCEFWKPKWK